MCRCIGISDQCKWLGSMYQLTQSTLHPLWCWDWKHLPVAKDRSWGPRLAKTGWARCQLHRWNFHLEAATIALTCPDSFQLWQFMTSLTSNANWKTVIPKVKLHYLMSEWVLVNNSCWKGLHSLTDISYTESIQSAVTRTLGTLNGFRQQYCRLGKQFKQKSHDNWHWRQSRSQSQSQRLV